jgi:hypothetical protein
MAVGKGEYLLEVKIIDGEVKAKIDGLTKGFVKLDTAAEKLRGSLGGANDGFGQTNSNAGLAGATLTELSRTISDMPYGINAVTNNLSQLSTLFITLQSKTKETAFGLGKFGGTIKGLLKELTGPLGIVLAFQAVITALDFYSMRSKKAKRETEELSDSMNEQLLILQNLNVALKENNITRKEASDIARGVLKQDKELKTILKDQSLSEEQRNERIIELAKKREEELVLQDKINKKQAELVETEKELISAVEAKATAQEAVTEAVSSDIEAYGFAKDKERKAIKSVNLVQEKQKQQLIELANLYSQQTTLIDENTTAKRENQKPVMEALENDYTMLELIEAQFTGITVEQLRLRKQAREELIESSKAGMDEFNQFSKDFLQKQKDIANANALIEQFKVDTAYRTVDSIRSIGIILESLAGENKGVMVAAIIAEKAAAIGEMIIATTKSNRAIAAAGLAASAFNPAAGAFAKKLILANKIGLGIDIASVVAQAGSAISSIGAPSKGGVGGDSSKAGSGNVIEAPDFNVVGASETSQLAQTVAGQQAKPVKAFVVGKDISTQQELDRNITTTASIG